MMECVSCKHGHEAQVKAGKCDAIWDSVIVGIASALRVRQ